MRFISSSLPVGDLFCVPRIPDCRCTLVSSSRSSVTFSEGVHVDLKRTAVPELFELVDTLVCGDDPRVKAGKPAPDIFLAAADELGVDPAR